MVINDVRATPAIGVALITHVLILGQVVANPWEL
jgi:hypothetical protein